MEKYLKFDDQVTVLTKHKELQQYLQFRKENDVWVQPYIKETTVVGIEDHPLFLSQYFLSNGIELNDESNECVKDTGMFLTFPIKAFGNGIYFAPRAKKSIGYSSLLGSYWTGGTQHKGYLAVYKVLFKNQKDVDVYHPYSLRNIKPHDAVYAHKGVSLRNDEVIIFREQQATLQYIIELNI